MRSNFPLRRVERLGYPIGIRPGRGPGCRQVGLRFAYGKPCVVGRVVFVFRAVVCDALNYYLGIVAAGEGAFGEGPIAFGLTFVPARQGPWAFFALAQMPWRFRCVFVNPEVAGRDLIRPIPSSGLGLS